MTWHTIKRHLSLHRGAYFFAPASLALLFGSLYLYRLLTGRSTIEDLSSLVGATINLILLTVSLIWSKFINDHLFANLTVEEFKAAGFWKRTLDSFQTIFCILLSIYIVFK